MINAVSTPNTIIAKRETAMKTVADLTSEGCGFEPTFNKHRSAGYNQPASVSAPSSVTDDSTTAGHDVDVDDDDDDDYCRSSHPIVISFTLDEVPSSDDVTVPIFITIPPTHNTQEATCTAQDDDDGSSASLSPENHDTTSSLVSRLGPPSDASCLSEDSSSAQFEPHSWTTLRRSESLDGDTEFGLPSSCSPPRKSDGTSKMDEDTASARFLRHFLDDYDVEMSVDAQEYSLRFELSFAEDHSVRSFV